MKVMLIYPLPRLVNKPGPHWLPLGLSFIGAALQKAGHNVLIFDRYATAASHSPRKEKINELMLQKIAEYKPDLIGFNTVSPLIFDTAECADLIRQQYDGLLVAGGHHATAMPELTLQKIPALNGLIQGEGEIALTRLANGEEPSVIPGVWWKSREVISGSAPEQVADLDSLALPTLDLMDMDFYTTPNRAAIRFQQLSVVSMITSRGCLNKCDFCTENLTYGRGVRMHSPGYVLEWMQKILADYKVNGFYFHDNDFLANRERAIEICEKLVSTGLNRKIKFAIQARVDHLDPEILKLLKKAGCSMIEMGIETFSQDHLDAVHKHTSADMNIRALQMCRDAGIAAHAYMIVGFAGEKASDLEERKRWLEKAGGHFTYDINDLKLHPGTKLYREKGNSFFENNEWNEKGINNFYHSDHLSSLNEEDKYAWLKETASDRRRRIRLSTLRHNPPGVLIRLALRKIGHVFHRLRTKII
jgi:radical SAM superfamily enzyme YgiQ (UPF0313 family)